MQKLFLAEAYWLVLKTTGHCALRNRGGASATELVCTYIGMVVMDVIHNKKRAAGTAGRVTKKQAEGSGNIFTPKLHLLLIQTAQIVVGIAWCSRSLQEMMAQAALQQEQHPLDFLGDDKKAIEHEKQRLMEIDKMEVETQLMQAHVRSWLKLFLAVQQDPWVPPKKKHALRQNVRKVRKTCGDRWKIEILLVPPIREVADFVIRDQETRRAAFEAVGHLFGA